MLRVLAELPIVAGLLLLVLVPGLISACVPVFVRRVRPVGQLVTIDFSYVLGTKNVCTRALARAALTAMAGFSLLLVTSMPFPFAGAVTNAPYVDLLQALSAR